MKFSCDREADEDYSFLREYWWFGGTVEGTGNGKLFGRRRVGGVIKPTLLELKVVKKKERRWK